MSWLFIFDDERLFDVAVLVWIVLFSLSDSLVFLLVCCMLSSLSVCVVGSDCDIVDVFSTIFVASLPVLPAESSCSCAELTTPIKSITSTRKSNICFIFFIHITSFFHVYLQYLSFVNTLNLKNLLLYMISNF